MPGSLTVYSVDCKRHASIDAATRAARGLPEDLIRLCVGIEDPHDLLDDLERALIEAGAIAFDITQNKYVRVPENDALRAAVESLRLDGGEEEEREWFISAPGKVILFGEHAVVHGVVSPCSFTSSGPRGTLELNGIVEPEGVGRKLSFASLGTCTVPTGVNLTGFLKSFSYEGIRSYIAHSMTQRLMQ